MPSIEAAQSDLAMYRDLSGESRNKLAKDLDTFLTLLTSQLKNQDPLSPMDSTEFTNQIVQFAQVEQQISYNEKLDDLITVSTGTQGAMAVHYIGQVIEAESSRVPLQDGTGRLAYGLAEDAASVGVIIADQAGTAVRSFQGETAAGVHEFRWDGKDDAGRPLPDGTYTISVTALNREEGQIDTWTTAFGRVDGVTNQDGQTMLVMGDQAVALDKVLSVTPRGGAPSQAADDPADDDAVEDAVDEALDAAADAAAELLDDDDQAGNPAA